MAIALMALVAALSGTAIASIPGNFGYIQSCYVKSSGALRVIDLQAGQRCTSNETRLYWRHDVGVGPTGPPGPAGPTGDTGPAGSGQQLSFGVNAGTPPAVLFEANGISIEFNCDGSSAGPLVRSSDSSSLQIMRVNTPVRTNSGASAEPGTVLYKRDPSFTTNETHELSDAGMPTIGTMVVRAGDGRIVTLDYAVDFNSGQGDCVFAGMAAVSA
jgi:hypothetical protein